MRKNGISLKYIFLFWGFKCVNMCDLCMTATLNVSMHGTNVSKKFAQNKANFKMAICAWRKLLKLLGKHEANKPPQRYKTNLTSCFSTVRTSSNNN